MKSLGTLTTQVRAVRAYYCSSLICTTSIHKEFLTQLNWGREEFLRVSNPFPGLQEVPIYSALHKKALNLPRKDQGDRHLCIDESV